MRFAAASRRSSSAKAGVVVSIEPDGGAITLELSGPSGTPGPPPQLDETLRSFHYLPGFLRAAVVVSTNSNTSNAFFGTMSPINAYGSPSGYIAPI